GKSRSVVAASQAAPVKVQEKPPVKQYTVQSGDTLIAIAQKYDVTVETLRDLNQAELGRNDQIQVGQKLNIPAQAQEKIEQVRPREVYISHSVKKNETLGSIARRYKTSVMEIQKANQMKKSSVIHPGEELKVPSSQEQV